MKAIVQHLRFPFSFLLLPVFLYSIFCIPVAQLNEQNAWILCIILHLLVYPASNAYNSTQDRDTGSVGLIESPLPIPTKLSRITLILDMLAIFGSLLINVTSTYLVIVYIAASRLYSWRLVRLKQYPIMGFLTVFICQGALVYYLVQYAANQSFDSQIHSGLLNENFRFVFNKYHLLQATIASLFIGSMYPLSQIYQHQQDKEDGVLTISAAMGYRNTFLFSGIQFVAASAFISSLLLTEQNHFAFAVYGICQFPVVTFFLYWFFRVSKDSGQANYKNTMYMNIISAVCMNACFGCLLSMKHWEKSTDFLFEIL